MPGKRSRCWVIRMDMGQPHGTMSTSPMFITKHWWRRSAGLFLGLTIRSLAISTAFQFTRRHCPMTPHGVNSIFALWWTHLPPAVLHSADLVDLRTKDPMAISFRIHKTTHGHPAHICPDLLEQMASIRPGNHLAGSLKA